MVLLSAHDDTDLIGLQSHPGIIANKDLREPSYPLLKCPCIPRLLKGFNNKQRPPDVARFSTGPQPMAAGSLQAPRVLTQDGVAVAGFSKCLQSTVCVFEFNV